MAFPDSFLTELVDRNDIVDVVGSYVELTKRSGSNQFGLCPFHSEKTPSFSVSADKQMYYCFGCQRGGGVVNFIMEVESLTFPEAVHYLADRVGMTVPDDRGNDEAVKRRGRMLKLNKAAAKHFYDNLSTQDGKAAVNYINTRRISAAMVKRFGLGCAPNMWSDLGDNMLKMGFSREELIASGLQKPGKNDSSYDTFRNRLIFPVIDIRGNVIGFSGRILDDGQPKYLNSPDTLVFNKSRNLFGLNLAKKSKSDYILLVEGNIDVVALHQAGFDNAVASLGTSLTDDQARLLSRYTNNVTIAFDSDSAGVNASNRATGILEKAGLQVKVLVMTGAKDPDEFIKKKGSDAFANLLEKSENHIKFKLATIKAKYDLDDAEQKLLYLREATGFLVTLPSHAGRDIYTRIVAETAGVGYEALDIDVKRALKNRGKTQKKKREQQAMRPERLNQPTDRSLRYENGKTVLAEEGIIRLMLKDPEIFKSADVSEADFSNSVLKKVYSVLIKRIRENRSVEIRNLTPDFDSSEISLLADIDFDPVDISNSQRLLDDYINKIRLEKLKSNPDENLRDLFEKYRFEKGVDAKHE